MGESQVDQQGGAVADQADIIGFDVAVEEAGPMQGGQGLGGLADDPDGAGQVEAIIAVTDDDAPIRLRAGP